MVNEVITSTDIYWITRCSNIQGTLIALTVITGILSVILTAVSQAHEYGKPVYKGKAHYITIPLFFIFCAGANLVPNTQEMIAIKVIPMIANNDNVQGVGQEMIDTAKQWLIELKPANIRR